MRGPSSAHKVHQTKPPVNAIDPPAWFNERFFYQFCYPVAEVYYLDAPVRLAVEHIAWPVGRSGARLLVEVYDPEHGTRSVRAVAPPKHLTGFQRTLMHMGVILSGCYDERYRQDFMAAADGRPTSRLTSQEEVSARHIAAFRRFTDGCPLPRRFRADRNWPPLEGDDHLVALIYEAYLKCGASPNRDDFQTFFERSVMDAAALFTSNPVIDPNSAADLWQRMCPIGSPQ